MVDSLMSTDPFHLDPDKFPGCVDLDLSEEVCERLLAMTRESGQSVQEVAEGILDACARNLAAEEIHDVSQQTSAGTGVDDHV